MLVCKYIFVYISTSRSSYVDASVFCQVADGVTTKSCLLFFALLLTRRARVKAAMLVNPRAQPGFC